MSEANPFPALSAPWGERGAGPAAPPPAPASARFRQFLSAAVAVALAGLATVVWLGGHADPRQGTLVSATTPIPVVAQAAAASGSANPQAIAAALDPSVVDINTSFRTATSAGSAAGTGIILTPDGEILTNNHVVEGATRISVTFAGQAGTYPAQVVGVDPTADVALLKVDGVSNLPVATLASSASLSVGQAVVAIGNAGGAGGVPSARAGSIVALGQSITASGGAAPERLTGMIQSDAAIAPGDSGGPLVNSAGQVIGMITAGQGATAGSTTTIGFAIPTDSALAVVNQIRAGQASAQVLLGRTGYLGITVTDLTPRLAARLGLSAASGALVVNVASGSPADQAGLPPYSLITAVAGTPVGSAAELGTVLHQHHPGEAIQVAWTDQSGAGHTATVTLTSGPAV